MSWAPTGAPAKLPTPAWPGRNGYRPGIPPHVLAEGNSHAKLFNARAARHASRHWRGRVSTIRRFVVLDFEPAFASSLTAVGDAGALATGHAHLDRFPLSRAGARTLARLVRTCGSLSACLAKPGLQGPAKFRSRVRLAYVSLCRSCLHTPILDRTKLCPFSSRACSSGFTILFDRSHVSAISTLCCFE